MRRKAKVWFVIWSVIILAPALSFASLRFNSTYVKVHLTRDGILEVTEKYEVTFLTPHHGIYRRIPLTFRDYETKKPRLIKIEHISTRFCNGTPVKHHTKTKRGYLYVYLGDKKKTIKGTYCYEITYSVRGAVGKKRGWYVLGWKAVGGKWDVALHDITIEASADFEVTPELYDWHINRIKPISPGRWYVREAGDMGRYLLVWYAWKTPLVPIEVIGPSKLGLLVPAGSCLFGAILFLYCLILWRREGRDPAVHASIMPEYYPPENLTPLEAGILIDLKLDGKDVAAALVSLAVKGYIRISEKKNKILGLVSFTDYEVTAVRPIKKDDPQLTYYEIEVARLVFNHLPAEGESTLLSELKNRRKTLRQMLEKLEKRAKKELEVRGLVKTLEGKKGKLAGLAVIGGFLCAFLSNLSVIFATGGIVPMVGKLPAPAIGWVGAVLAFLSLIPTLHLDRRTPEGRKLYLKLKGWIEFVKKTEAERLKALFPPSEHPVVFEKYFPYALALGVVKEWAQKWEKVFVLTGASHTPGWYSGSSFSPSSFAKSFSSAASSSAGGSGGGGAGGGGGGGW